MNAFLFANEPLIRLGGFFGVLLVMAIWEGLAPRRAQHVSRQVRWPNNLGIVVLNTLLARLLLAGATIATAVHAQQQGWGLFNMVAAPDWLAVVLSVLLLDMAIYAQHVLFHYAPPLWRLHRMHHADLEFDVTTGLRFHPVEIILSLLIKLAVIVAIGAPALAVLIFEVLLNATSMFNHSNVRIKSGVDRLLRLVLVTPDMHRVHHSIHKDETNSNFGFNLPWWDRLFGTYRPQPRDGHLGMTIGLPVFRDPAELRLDRMLLQPLRKG
ncbi:MAG: sterol desaturase family protein [Sphingomonadales bacterium]